MSEYRVRVDVYNGPMDLLLYLIRRDEVDIADIPIARITEQYCRYVEMLETIDPNIAGDFLVVAAMLMEIKSRMLLPRPTGDDGDPDDLADPRLELVRQLLEYKKYKDASFELATAGKTQAQRWPRVPTKAGRQEPAEVDLDDVQIWDLVGAFNRLMSEIGAAATTHDVIFDDTPIALHAADLLDRLQADDGELDFRDVFAGRTKVEMIGLFLALLEMMRQGRVRIRQAGIFAPIRIVLLSAEPIEVGEEWESAIRDAVLGDDFEATTSGDSEAIASGEAGTAAPIETESAAAVKEVSAPTESEPPSSTASEWAASPAPQSDDLGADAGTDDAAEDVS